MATGAQPYLMELPGGMGQLEVFLPHEVLHKLVEKHGIDELCLTDEERNSETGLGHLLREWRTNPDVQVDDPNVPDLWLPL
jgi:hypothetical protein